MQVYCEGQGRHGAEWTTLKAHKNSLGRFSRRRDVFKRGTIDIY